MTWFTVIGAWVNDEALVVGVVKGRHDVLGTAHDEGWEEGCWAEQVQAENPDGAASAATRRMESTLIAERVDR